MGLVVREPNEWFPSFVQKSEDEDECWIWKGAAHRGGYGYLYLDGGRFVYAHRFAWELAHGPIPSGRRVYHRCGVRLCVRPEHLYVAGAENGAS